MGICVCVLEYVDTNSQCLDISRFKPRLGLREYEPENVGGSCDQKATRGEHLRETPCRNRLLQLSTHRVLYSFRAIFKNFTQRNAPPTFFFSNHHKYLFFVVPNKVEMSLRVEIALSLHPSGPGSIYHAANAHTWLIDFSDTFLG